MLNGDSQFTDDHTEVDVYIVHTILPANGHTFEHALLSFMRWDSFISLQGLKISSIHIMGWRYSYFSTVWNERHKSCVFSLVMSPPINLNNSITYFNIQLPLWCILSFHVIWRRHRWIKFTECTWIFKRVSVFQIRILWTYDLLKKLSKWDFGAPFLRQ